MLVNNNRVYSSKLACSLSPCPTLGSRWCNVTAQFQHLPSLSKTGPGVLRGPGRVRNVVVCDTLATELWEQNTAPLIPAQSCGVRWGRTSGAWCWCQPLLRTLSCLSAGLVTRLAWPLGPPWSCALDDWKMKNYYSNWKTLLLVFCCFLWIELFEPI